MVKRILLCDWEGNIKEVDWMKRYPHWEYNKFNYTKEQILVKNRLKREDAIIKKWMETL